MRRARSALERNRTRGAEARRIRALAGWPRRREISGCRTDGRSARGLSIDDVEPPRPRRRGAGSGPEASTRVWLRVTRRPSNDGHEHSRAGGWSVCLSVSCVVLVHLRQPPFQGPANTTPQRQPPADTTPQAKMKAPRFRATGGRLLLKPLPGSQTVELTMPGVPRAALSVVGAAGEQAGVGGERERVHPAGVALERGGLMRLPRGLTERSLS
jgi:hypothetical protein